MFRVLTAQNSTFTAAGEPGLLDPLTAADPIPLSSILGEVTVVIDEGSIDNK
jgi:hypothetical protein